MAEQRSSRRLTRADVLVAAITCLLLILLVPVLFARPRERTVRRLCAANLAQIGKAMLVYAGEYEGALPRAGGPRTKWLGMPYSLAWKAPDRRIAFNVSSSGEGGQASISASLYLLVRYYQMPPRVFVCKGDLGTTEFKLSGRTDIPSNFELDDAWDFGPPDDSFKHCSYAYHIPYNLYALSTSRDPNLAVAADRSPWFVSPAADPSIWENFRPDVGPNGSRWGTSDQARIGNSPTHGKDGQNVLFLDGRVEFERRSYCGVDRDNVYSISSDTVHGDMTGVRPRGGAACVPANKNDSVLVHDPDTFGG